ncbi:MAG: DNA polymerase III subunit beta [Deltaproteobacteria bacterium]|nr:DNA polymerase III subunit beta [Deltaproteobacteria bacterium]
MELKITREELLKGTGRAQAIAEKRSSMQILSNLLLKTTPTGIEILATDLEIGFTGSYQAQVADQGQVCLPARNFHRMIRDLGSEEVSLKTQENQRVLIEGGKTRHQLAGLPAEEYPALPPHEEVELIDIRVEDLAEMLDKTIYSMAAEEGRYNLAGVYLEKVEDDQMLRLVSTDGHRLSVVDRPLDRLANLDLARGAIMPRKGVMEMRRLLEEAEAARFGVKGSTAVLKVGEASLIMRLLETRYPDYRQVVPSDEGAVSFTVTRPLLLDALRRVSALITDKYRGVKLEVQPDSLVISHQNPDEGESRETMDVDYAGQPMTLAFNANYLNDALKAMRSEEVTFSLIDPTKPSKITGPADEKFMAVIMPLQI